MHTRWVNKQSKDLLSGFECLFLPLLWGQGKRNIGMGEKSDRGTNWKNNKKTQTPLSFCVVCGHNQAIGLPLSFQAYPSTGILNSEE